MRLQGTFQGDDPVNLPFGVVLEGCNALIYPDFELISSTKHFVDFLPCVAMKVKVFDGVLSKIPIGGEE